MKPLRRFDLEHELLVDDHVECLRGQRLSPIAHRDGDFTFDAMAFGYEVSFQGKRIDVFPKPESERSMDVIEHTNDGARERLFEHFSIASRSHSERSSAFECFRII